MSNDDGFAAKGIQELIKVLRPMADLMVVLSKSIAVRLNRRRN